MHLPDGVISNQASLGFIAAVIAVGSLALGKAKDLLWEKSKLIVPQLATNVGLDLSDRKVINKIKLKKENINNTLLIFSLIFTVQMVDFVHINSTPGHLIGSILAAIVLGPWLGMIAVSAVLILQAILLGDGGTIALGINIFNMAIIGSVGGYYIYLILRKIIKNRNIVIFLSSWLIMVIMSVCYCFEVGIFSNVNLGEIFVPMVLAHILAGVVEGILTVLAIKYLFNNKKI